MMTSFINYKNISLNNYNIEVNMNKSNNQREDIDLKMKYYENFIDDLEIYNHTHIFSDKIYWCWLQGFNKAPELYKAAYNSVNTSCINHSILVINQTNLYKYVKFPSYILEKYKKKVIDNTHFSDLLRLELLIKYGGTWIDASVLMTKYNKNFFRKDLFFFRTVNYTKISGSNWFITAEIESPVLKTTRDLIYEYWRKENYLCDYFIFHLLFKFAFQKYYNDYLQMPYYTNIPVHFLQKHLMNKFNDTLYTNILKSASVHKLNKKFPSNNESFIYYIIRKYMNKNNTQ